MVREHSEMLLDVSMTSINKMLTDHLGYAMFVEAETRGLKLRLRCGKRMNESVIKEIVHRMQKSTDLDGG